MDQTYHKTVSELEQMGADPEYIVGWECGYLHNPKREEQRVTEAYEAGYQDGREGSTANAKSWLKKAAS